MYFPHTDLVKFLVKNCQKSTLLCLKEENKRSICSQFDWNGIKIFVEIWAFKYLPVHTKSCKLAHEMQTVSMKFFVFFCLSYHSFSGFTSRVLWRGCAYCMYISGVTSLSLSRFAILIFLILETYIRKNQLYFVGRNLMSTRNKQNFVWIKWKLLKIWAFPFSFAHTKSYKVNGLMPNMSESIL